MPDGNLAQYEFFSYGNQQHEVRRLGGPRRFFMHRAADRKPLRADDLDAFSGSRAKLLAIK
jgi:hypothetical protein